jgi:ABC-2 type transport system ATP-binding protein
MVELTKVKKQLARTLSGGERTRLALATALVGNPELIILDEPTVGLDPVLRKDLWEIFRKLVKSGKTLLISSHVMDEAENCDFIYLMREGEIIANGTTQDLKMRTNQSDMENVFISLVKS